MFIFSDCLCFLQIEAIFSYFKYWRKIIIIIKVNFFLAQKWHQYLDIYQFLLPTLWKFSNICSKCQSIDKTLRSYRFGYFYCSHFSDCFRYCWCHCQFTLPQKDQKIQKSLHSVLSWLSVLYNFVGYST